MPSQVCRRGVEKHCLPRGIQFPIGSTWLLSLALIPIYDAVTATYSKGQSVGWMREERVGGSEREGVERIGGKNSAFSISHGLLGCLLSYSSGISR